MESSTRPRYALDVIRTWPNVTRRAAHHVLMVHKAPDELSSDALCWSGIGPWKRVVVCAGQPDEDPAEVADSVIEAVVEATVPAARRAVVDEVAEEFQVHIEDDGEISVRGRDLPSNVITLNVLHALVEGELSVEQARSQRARDLAALREGRLPAGAETLRFADDAPCGEPRPAGARSAGLKPGPAGTHAS